MYGVIAATDQIHGELFVGCFPYRCSAHTLATSRFFSPLAKTKKAKANSKWALFRGEFCLVKWRGGIHYAQLEVITFVASAAGRGEGPLRSGARSVDSHSNSSSVALRRALCALLSRRTPPERGCRRWATRQTRSLIGHQ